MLCNADSMQKKLSKHLPSSLSQCEPGPLAVLYHFSQHSCGWQQSHNTTQKSVSAFFQPCKVYTDATLSDSIFLPNPNSSSASLFAVFLLDLSSVSNSVHTVSWQMHSALRWCKLVTAWDALRAAIASSILARTIRHLEILQVVVLSAICLPCILVYFIGVILRVLFSCEPVILENAINTAP